MVGKKEKNKKQKKNPPSCHLGSWGC
jgi:hypothetical protein